MKRGLIWIVVGVLIALAGTIALPFYYVGVLIVLAGLGMVLWGGIQQLRRKE